MKYIYPDHKLKAEFTPGTWGENQWCLGESACVSRSFYVLPDGTEFAFFKFCERTMTGRKKTRWEEWHNGKLSNNHFNCEFDTAAAWMDRYINFNFDGKRQDYRVY